MYDCSGIELKIYLFITFIFVFAMYCIINLHNVGWSCIYEKIMLNKYIAVVGMKSEIKVNYKLILC